MSRPASKPVTCIEDLYERSKILPSGCRVLKSHRRGSTYSLIKVAGVPVVAHRLAWTLAFGEIPSGLFALHKCDYRPCFDLDHLFLGTARDRKQKGRKHSIPLSEAQIEEICDLYIVGVDKYEIGRRFGMSASYIYKLATRLVYTPQRMLQTRSTVPT